MAGYVFNLDSLESLSHCIETGTYGTRIAPPNHFWSRPAEATFGDYITMRPGDNVYFFIQRNLYGVGTMRSISGEDDTACSYRNYPDSLTPRAYTYDQIKEGLLADNGPVSADERWICTFAPSPSFFVNGVDMDDVLTSNPTAFRILRAFWKRSFVKLDDEENQALKDVIIKNNERFVDSPAEGAFFSDAHAEHHRAMGARIAQRGLGAYSLSSAPFLQECVRVDASVAHEMALEIAILDRLSAREPDFVEVFGAWDYLSHQVIASPFKPIDYMDAMDLFGYRFVAGHRPTIGHYLVGEVKAGTAHGADLLQVMKYVDWVKDEYAHGDYNMIRAFLVARDFAPDALAEARDARRLYTFRRRPAESREWHALRLVGYECLRDDGRLRLQCRYDGEADAD